MNALLSKGLLRAIPLGGVHWHQLAAHGAKGERRKSWQRRPKQNDELRWPWGVVLWYYVGGLGVEGDRPALRRHW